MGTAIGFELCDRIDALSYNCGELKIENDERQPQGIFKQDFGQVITSKQAAVGILKDMGHDEYRSAGHLQHDFFGWFNRKALEFNYEGIKRFNLEKSRKIWNKQQGQKKKVQFWIIDFP